MYRLEQSQIVRASPEQVWEFLRHPRNLNRITPPDMSFEILSDLPEEMYDGLLIEYRIGIPLLGKQRWLTEIKHIREGRSFVDEQRFGPYKFWYHYHGVETVPEGTRVVDRVCYALPFGMLAHPVHALFVRPTLERVFAFRRERFEELLS